MVDKGYFQQSGVSSWISKKQNVVGQSTAEAKYIGVSAATNQAVWLRKILVDSRQVQKSASVIWVDSKSAIAGAKNPVLHRQTKHKNTKRHALRDAKKSKVVNRRHCSSDEQLADIMTKALPKNKLETLRSKLGVKKKNLKEEC